MTSRERILAAVQRKPVDHVPCAPFMNPQSYVQRLGKLWQYPFGPSREEIIDYMVRVQGVDQVLDYAWGFYHTPGVSEEKWMDGDILHKNIHTPSGTLHAAVRITEGWPHGYDIPLIDDYLPAHCVEFWIKNEQDVACLRHIMQPPSTKNELAAIRFSHNEAKQLAKRYGIATCFAFGRGLTGAVSLFGPSEVCMAVLDQPGLVEEYLEIEHECTMKSYEIALDLGVDMVRRNGFYESCDLFNPTVLRELVHPRIAKEAKLVHEAGNLFTYTLFSAVMPMLEDIKKLDLDSLVCLDIFIKNEDGALISKVLSPRMSFWTGPSDTVHMPVDDPEAVRRAVRHVFDAFGKRGLIITPCASSKAVFPWGNVLAMIDEWKKLGF